jgi:hypothetical protein
MSFEKIISIPGMGGLFKMVAQMRNGGFVVEGLTDNKRIPVSAMQRIIMLKDVAVYTKEEDVPLYNVFKKMKDHDELSSSISSKADGAELKASLKKVFPEFDEDRVHVSDIKKMFSWYVMLKDMIGTPETEAIMNPAPVEDSPVATPTEEAVVAEAPKAKSKSKADVEEVIATDATEEVSKKKVTRKKKTDDAESSSEETTAAPKKKAAAKKTTKEK